jgi:uncharacterized protein YjhX (UPF0386 family)
MITPLTHEQRLELTHLWTVTRDGRWSFRGGNTAVLRMLARRGLIETQDAPHSTADYSVCRITAEGISALLSTVDTGTQS